MTLLNPPPAEVADQLIRMIHLDWPTNEADRRRYFDILDLDDLDTVPKRDDEPDTRMIRFVTALPDVDGTCTMFRDELLGLSLFCYNEPIDNGPDASAGYVSLQDELTRFLGVPSEEWGTLAEPACLWRAGPLWIDMYCFQRLRSGVMVGPSHAEQSAANDAAHDAQRSDPRIHDASSN